MSESNRDNPYLEATAKKPNGEVTRDDCYWGSREEDVLYDAYLILRDSGYSEKELEPLGKLIERTTIYEIENMESVFEWMVNRGD